MVIFLSRRSGLDSRRTLIKGKLAQDGLAVAVGCHLANDHIVIATTSSHEFFVGAALDDAAFFHQEDHVSTANGGETMGNDERSAAREEGCHRRLNELFAFGVEVAGGFVEDENLR